MTDKFLEIHKFVKKWEGGFNDIKNDMGGATNWGISIRFLKDFFIKNKAFCNSIGITHVDLDVMRDLTEHQSQEIFYKEFYQKNNFEELPTPLALCFYDMAANSGIGNATKIMQRAYNDTNPSINLVVDGMLGQRTMSALARFSNLQLLIGHIYERRNAYYNAIVANRPSNEIFLKGWLNRSNDMNKTARQYI